MKSQWVIMWCELVRLKRKADTGRCYCPPVMGRAALSLSPCVCCSKNSKCSACESKVGNHIRTAAKCHREQMRASARLDLVERLCTRAWFTVHPWRMQCAHPSSMVCDGSVGKFCHSSPSFGVVGSILDSIHRMASGSGKSQTRDILFRKKIIDVW